MRIMYGVHGYGRGHAMRAAALIPELEKRHDVLVLAGTEAYDVLASRHRTIRIPKFGFYYRRAARISALRTLRFNTPAYLDLALRGPVVQMVAEVMDDFAPDVVISDSEAFTLRAARVRGVPRIICDHFGLLVFCKPSTRGLDRWIRWGQAVVYRALYGNPDRAVVCGFFEAPPRRAGITVVGPIIREDVRHVRVTEGDYLLVYISKGDQEYTPQIEQAILELDFPVRVYGAPRAGREGNVEFRPLANRPFIEDLAGCRAVFATTGNQLIGEVIYLRKPMLGMPIDCLEQRLNAQYLEDLGIGMRVKRNDVTASLIHQFFDSCDEYRERLKRLARDGRAEGLAALEECFDQLVDGRARHVEDMPRWHDDDLGGGCTESHNDITTSL